MALNSEFMGTAFFLELKAMYIYIYGLFPIKKAIQEKGHIWQFTGMPFVLDTVLRIYNIFKNAFIISLGLKLSYNWVFHKMSHNNKIGSKCTRRK